MSHALLINSKLKDAVFTSTNLSNANLIEALGSTTDFRPPKQPVTGQRAWRVQAITEAVGQGLYAEVMQDGDEVRYGG